MQKLARQWGTKMALAALGLDTEQYTPATNQDGRLRDRTQENPQDQARTAFSEQQRQLETSISKNADVSYQQVKKRSPVKVVEDPATSGWGSYYMPKTDKAAPYIQVSKKDKNPYLLTHEIGHAQQHGTPAGNAFGKARLLSLFAPLAGLATGYYLKKPLPTTLGVAGSLGLTAPTLIDEGIADYRGYKLLEELGASPKQRREYLKTIAPYQASYLAMLPITLGMVAAGAILKKKANYEIQDRLNFRGLNISIENKKGTYRHWKDSATGKKGKTLQKYPYGYIRMSEGMDGDHVDCYVGPNEYAKNVYVVTTNKSPDFSRPDEQKCMLGFNSATAAKEAFLMHFNDKRFLREIKSIPFDNFNKKVLATRSKSNKKIASNFYEGDYQRPLRTEIPTDEDKVALPTSSLVGMRHEVGNAMDVPDRVDRMFRKMDDSNITPDRLVME